MLQLTVVNGTLSSQKYRGEIMESDVIPSLNSPESQSMVLQDNNARPKHARIIEDTQNLQNIASLP